MDLLFKTGCASAAIAALLACSTDSPSRDAVPPTAVEVAAPTGRYQLDPTHASLLVRATHFGLSHYTIRVTRFDATLDFDTNQPELSAISAVVDMQSIQTNHPIAGVDFDAALRSPEWLDTQANPQATFRSTEAIRTGVNTARVAGDLTLRGVTQPVALDVTFNRAFAHHPYRANGPALLGFSARGVISRSAFGMTNFLPSEEFPVAVEDELEVIIEAEFNRPYPAQRGSDTGGT